MWECFGGFPIRQELNSIDGFFFAINGVDHKKSLDSHKQLHSIRLKSGGQYKARTVRWKQIEEEEDYPFSKECPLQLVKYMKVL